MIKKLNKFLLVLTVSFYLFHFLFFWIFEGTDSYFYWAFGNFIRTGKYIAPHPYYYTVPSTMEPPLYSVFLFLTDHFKRADILIHFFQIASIFAAGYLIYRIMRHYFPQEFAVLAGLLFLLIPAHFNYVSHMVAETIAIFFLSIYLYFVHLIYNKKKSGLIKYLLLVSSIMTLLRYNFFPLFGLAAVIFIFSKYRRKITDSIYLAGGIGIIVAWIVFNHSLNGAWGLSNAEGKHLYNRIVAFDKLLPPKDDPDFIKFRKIVGENADYFKPWWFFEKELIINLGSETESSLLMQKVALSALKTNPFRYLVNTPIFFIYAHNTNDMFHNEIFLTERKMLTVCRKLNNIEFCRPIIEASLALTFWDKINTLADFYYLYIWRYINFFLLFPSLLFAFFQKNTFIKFCSLSYIICVLLFVAAEQPLPRYTYIFRPLGLILISFMLYRLFGRLYEKKSGYFLNIQ